MGLTKMSWIDFTLKGWKTKPILEQIQAHFKMSIKIGEKKSLSNDCVGRSRQLKGHTLQFFIFITFVEVILE